MDTYDDLVREIARLQRVIDTLVNQMEDTKEELAATKEELNVERLRYLSICNQ